MSRYMVNKLMWEVDISDHALAEFKADRAGFVERWEAIPPQPPVPTGGRLDEAERRAVIDLDWAALYAMGANPFLLWQFARSVTVPDLAGIDELISDFRVTVEPFGRPDFHT